MIASSRLAASCSTVPLKCAPARTALRGWARRGRVYPARLLKRRAQVLQERRQAARPAAEVKGLKRSRYRPAHADRARDDVIKFLLGDHPLANEVDGLAEERGLQAVGNETGDLLSHHLWPLGP